MPGVLVILAEGFEELEAAAPITILRRAAIDVTTAGLRPGPVRGARGIAFVPDAVLDDVARSAFDAVVLPGGMPGAANLEASGRVAEVVRSAAERGAIVAAICAAPAVLLRFGLLAGRRATGHASIREALAAGGAAVVPGDPVVSDGRIVTSAGAGTAVPFGLALVRELAGEARAAEVARGMMLDR
jgi:4-methyl-5(b-hydroxyethyl)-thiazole monophosphate biosynthesis